MDLNQPVNIEIPLPLMNLEVNLQSQLFPLCEYGQPNDPEFN